MAYFQRGMVVSEGVGFGVELEGEIVHALGHFGAVREFACEMVNPARVWHIVQVWS